MGDETDGLLVEAKNLGKAFGDLVALHPLNVKVSSGEFFGVFGPNGAGKSTFIKLLTGQLQPTVGGVRGLGVDVGKNARKVKANVGIVDSRRRRKTLWPSCPICSASSLRSSSRASVWAPSPSGASVTRKRTARC